MRISLRGVFRIAVLFVTILLVSALTAGLIWPELFDGLPEPMLVHFRDPPRTELQMVSVSGNLTFDGDPIGEGEIRFVPLNKSLNPDYALIKDGKYVTQVKKGEHKVEIRGYKGEKQFIPARFNADTELRFQAKEGEQNFDLHSDKK